MTRGLLLGALVCLFFPFAGCSSKGADMRAIDGVWVPVNGELGGQPFPDAALKSMKLTVHNGAYTVDVGGKLDKGTLELDTSVLPHTMDINSTQGANAGKSFPAIYEVVGDTLRICYNLGGRERPEGFITVDGRQDFLVNYTKVEP